MPSVFVLMFIVFPAIASDYVPMAITRDDRSGAAPPPPNAIASEFAAMLIMFMLIFSVLALTIYSFIIAFVRFY